MEIIIVAMIHVLLLMRGVGFLVVSQTSGFIQSGIASQRQNIFNSILPCSGSNRRFPPQVPDNGQWAFCI